VVQRPVMGLFADYLGGAETGRKVTADSVDKEYTGDNRPEFIRNKTDIDADTYNQFLSELDDITAQSNLDYRQEQLRSRIDAEAQGTRYQDPSDAVSQNLQRQNELFEQQSEELLNKYGIPRTFTTDSGSRYRFNPQGEYTKVFDAGPDFGDYLKAGIKMAITTVATAGIGSAVAAGLGAAGLPANIANVVADVVVNAARSGGDLQQGIISALTGSGELRTVTDYFPDGLEGMVNVARSVYDAANAAIDPEVDTAVDITIDPDQDEEVVIDDDGNISINVPPPAVNEPEDGGGGGGGGDTTEGGEAVDDSGAVDDSEVVDDSGAVEDSEVVDDSGAVDDTFPPITTDGIFDPQMPWIYQGNGVFVHGETGETVTEDVSEYDPYVVGETYGRGTDEPFSPEDADEGEDDLLGTDIFSSTIDPDTTITPEVVVEPTPPTPATPPTPPTDTVDVIVDPEDAFGGGTAPLPPEVIVEPTPPTPPQPPTLPTDDVDVIVDPEDAFNGGATPLPPEIVVEPTPTPPTLPQPPTPPADDDGIFIDPEDAFGGGDDIGDGGGNGDGGTDGGVDGVDDGGGDDEGGGDDAGVDDTGGTDGGTDTGEGDGDGSGTGGGTGTGTGGGEGEGEGTGEGEGSGSGTGGGLSGRGTGMFTGGGSSGFTPQSFMASISYAPELLTPYMPQNSRDYLAELLARLQK
jgi:hypothetical protein